MSVIKNLFTLRGWIAARLILCLVASPLFITSCGDFAALNQAKSFYDKLKDADTNNTLDSQDSVSSPQFPTLPANYGTPYPQTIVSGQNTQVPFECPQGTTKFPVTTRAELVDGNIMTDALFKKGDSISISLGTAPQNVTAVLIKDNSPIYSYLKEVEIRFITTTIFTYTSSKLRITRNSTHTSITRSVNFTEIYQASAPSGGTIHIPSGANSIYTNTTEIEIDIKDTQFNDIHLGEILVCVN